MHVVDSGARGSRGPTYFQVRPPPLDALDLHSPPLTRDDPPGTATAGVILVREPYTIDTPRTGVCFARSVRNECSDHVTLLAVSLTSRAECDRQGETLAMDGPQVSNSKDTRSNSQGSPTGHINSKRHKSVSVPRLILRRTHREVQLIDVGSVTHFLHWFRKFGPVDAPWRRALARRF